MDEEWLEEVVKACFWGVDGGDGFLRELWKGWKEVREKGIKQVSNKGRRDGLEGVESGRRVRGGLG